MKVLDLFSGIGGFSLGLERAGMETVAFCEIEEFPRKVLAKHWPDVKCYTDVRTLTAERLRDDGIGAVDVITGGFPCQDVSSAGSQAGIDGERSGLWGELCRLIGELQPRFAIVENVTALISGGDGRWLGRVLGDLAEIGYDAEWHCIPASALGACHRRDRWWCIAHPVRVRGERLRNEQQELGEAGQGRARYAAALQSGIAAYANDVRQQRQGRAIQSGDSAQNQNRQVNRVKHVLGWPIEPPVRRRNDGIPSGVDRLRSLGNAVVPQIPEIIGRAIMEIENANPT